MIEFKILSESDDISGHIGSISHDDFNSLNDLDSLFDLKNAKKQGFRYWVVFLVSATLTVSFCGIDHWKSNFSINIWHSLFQRLWRPVFDTYLKSKGQKSKSLLLNIPLKENQQNHWSFYPFEPFTFGHFNMRHPVGMKIVIWSYT